MKLLVVIANYRVADLTIDCLRRLADEIASVPGTHVAVCENGTGDDFGGADSEGHIAIMAGILGAR